MNAINSSALKAVYTFFSFKKQLNWPMDAFFLLSTPTNSGDYPISIIKIHREMKTLPQF